MVPWPGGSVNTSDCVIVFDTEGGVDESEPVLPKGGKVTRRSIAEYAGGGPVALCAACRFQ